MSLTGWNKVFTGIRFRLTLVYSTLFGLFLCVFAYIISAQHFQSGREEFDSNLFNYAIDLSEHLVIDESSLNVNFKLPKSEIKKAFPFLLKQTYYSVRDFSGHIIARSHKEFPFEEIPYNPKLPLKQNYTYRYLSFVDHDDTYRAVNLKISNDKGREMILQVSTSLNNLLERERNQIIITSIIVPLLILCSSFFSYLISGNALLPIKSLTDAANNIAAQNLSLRVPVVNTGDEVEELAKTLNNLLARLEKSFTAQENFVANASHQLNTPLAIIKGELAVLQSKERTKEDNEKFFASLREELERLIDLVKKMLLVSRVESGLEKFEFSPVRLDEVLLGTSSRLKTKAREHKTNIRFNIAEELSSSDLEIMGDRQLLDTIFENILENAIKYSPEGGAIYLDIKKMDHHTEVWVQDEGQGMSEESFQDMLNGRFKRGEGIRIPGTGIGLPIAQKIADFHQARIIYKKREPQGSLFIIRFS